MRCIVRYIFIPSSTFGEHPVCIAVCMKVYVKLVFEMVLFMFCCLVHLADFNTHVMNAVLSVQLCMCVHVTLFFIFLFLCFFFFAALLVHYIHVNPRKAAFRKLCARYWSCADGAINEHLFIWTFIRFCWFVNIFSQHLSFSLMMTVFYAMNITL